MHRDTKTKTFKQLKAWDKDTELYPKISKSLEQPKKQLFCKTEYFHIVMNKFCQYSILYTEFNLVNKSYAEY